MPSNKNKYFWPIQIISWSLMALFNFGIQYLAGSAQEGFRIEAVIVNAVTIFIGGIFFTSLFRYGIKKYNWESWSKLKLIFISIISSILIVLFWTLFVIAIFSVVVDGFEIGLLGFLVSLFPLGMIVVIWMLCYFSYQFVRKYHFNEIEKWKLKAEIQKAELGSLKSQINPHFMFNTLNNIKALMLEDVHLARIMITNFSELLSYSLQHAEKKEVCISDELEIVRKYLDLVKIQYEEKLNYSIKIDDASKDEFVPPMILQLIVENAIKHGISQQINGGEVIVDVSKRNNDILINVKNTGTLSVKNTLEKSLGIGLNNIRERLKLIYDGNAFLNIKEEKPYVIVDVAIKK